MQNLNTMIKISVYHLYFGFYRPAFLWHHAEAFPGIPHLAIQLSAFVTLTTAFALATLVAGWATSAVEDGLLMVSPATDPAAARLLATVASPVLLILEAGSLEQWIAINWIKKLLKVKHLGLYTRIIGIINLQQKHLITFTSFTFRARKWVLLYIQLYSIVQCIPTFRFRVCAFNCKKAH